MGDVNLEIKLSNLDERVIKIEETGGGSGGDGYITSVSNDFNVVNKKLSLSNDVTTKLSKIDTTDNLSVELAKKIDKPASAAEGQVLTYNATSGVWEAQDSKGGGADTSIISDAWESRADHIWNSGEYCIHNNILWKCTIASGSTTVEPSETATSDWTACNVMNEIGAINYSLEWKYFGKIKGVSKIDISPILDIAKEYYCVIWSSNKPNISFPIHFPSNLINSGKTLYSGYRYNNTSYGSTRIELNTTNNIAIGHININSDSSENITYWNMEVYYK